MATKIQKVLQAPLLIDVATLGRAVDATRGGDVPDIIDRLWRAYERAGARERTDDFRNDVQWAKKQLEDHGCLDVRPRRSWTVTDKGLARLQNLAGIALQELPIKDLTDFWHARPEIDEERGVAMLKQLPAELIVDSLARHDCNTCTDLFRIAFERIPEKYVEAIYLPLYEALLELFFTYGDRLACEAVM